VFVLVIVFEQVYRLMKRLYKRTRMQPECVVMTVAFVERLLRGKCTKMSPYTWYFGSFLFVSCSLFLVLCFVQASRGGGCDGCC
jgi:hypothetical protein